MAGNVTVVVSAAAMAASMALPPLRKASMPAATASGWPAATMPPRAMVRERVCANEAAKASSCAPTGVVVIISVPSSLRRCNDFLYWREITDVAISVPDRPDGLASTAGSQP